MEIDGKWQAARRYMKIMKEDQFSREDNPLLEEIKEVKEGVKTSEGLVVI